MPEQPGSSGPADRSADDESPRISFSLRSSGSSGTLGEGAPDLWERVEAFRDLLQRGARLLGEVIEFTRSAECAVAALEREKSVWERQNRAWDEERERVRGEEGELEDRAKTQRKETEGLSAMIDRNQSALVVKEIPGSDTGADLVQRLSIVELELKQTRQALKEERARRDRAILLIKPADSTGPQEQVEAKG